MGTKEPDNLFLGMTNPDLTPNMETLGLLAELVDMDFAMGDCAGWESLAEIESSFDAILFTRDILPYLF